MNVLKLLVTFAPQDFFNTHIYGLFDYDTFELVPSR